MVNSVDKNIVEAETSIQIVHVVAETIRAAQSFCQRSPRTCSYNHPRSEWKQRRECGANQ